MRKKEFTKLQEATEWLHNKYTFTKEVIVTEIPVQEDCEYGFYQVLVVCSSKMEYQTLEIQVLNREIDSYTVTDLRDGANFGESKEFYKNDFKQALQLAEEFQDSEKSEKVIDVKNLIADYKKMSAITGNNMQAWENDPFNVELEKEFDDAYKLEYEAYTLLCEHIVSCSRGEIDIKTAGSMIRRRFDDLENLFLRCEGV